MRLSVVIPAYRAVATLGSTLDTLAAELQPNDEIVVVDAESGDGTATLAARRGARVLAAPRGRGTQLAAGAAAATGDWMLFLHADTRPAPGWRAAIEKFAGDAGNMSRAGYLRLVLDDPSNAARRIEWWATWRARSLGLPYGDQGLLLSRSFYNALGGYRALPLMEDVDLVRRIGRQRLAALPVAAVTSADRYRRDGWWARPFRNLLCLLLYFLGAPLRWIERFYA